MPGIMAIAGNLGIFVMMAKVQVEAAGAVHNLAVFAHFLAIEGQHLVRRIVAFKFQRNHLHAKERA